jgi:phosphomethylpyrimidine synthase
MKITQDIRDYAKDNGLSEEEAIDVGMEEKAQAYRNTVLSSNTSL